MLDPVNADANPEPAQPVAMPPVRPAGMKDLTQGPIGRTLLIFALPTLAANILQSLNGSINAVWVGRFLGEDALAATSNANLVMFLLLGGIFGMGIAATILVGQNMGRKDLEGARRAIATAVGLFGLGSIVTAIVGYFAAPAILHLLATPPGASALAESYLRVIFLGMPGAFLVVILSMGLRGAGDSITPLIIMILTAVLDTGLNPVLILGLGPAPRMGIAGSATATAIAAYASVIAMIAIIYIRDLPLRLRGQELRWLLPDPALLRVIVAKGIPMSLQMLVVSLSGVAFIGIVNRHGVEVTAAYGVALQLWTYLQMPALAVGAAVSAMAAQNIGAQLWDRVDAVTRAGILTNLLMTGLLLVLLSLFDHALMGLFLGSDSPALPIAQHMHHVASWSFLMFGVTMVVFGTVRANGAVYAPLIILALAMFPIRLGIALWLSPRLGADALWYSMPVGSAASMLMALAYYRAGRWRTIRMTTTSPRELTPASAAEAPRPE
jgi:putative MATE family efflux protein